MRTVFFVVTMIICAIADTAQRGLLCKNTRTLSQMDPIKPIRISNRVRRNASDTIKVSKIPEPDKTTRDNLMKDILSHIPSKDIIEYLVSGRRKRSYTDYDSSEDQEIIDPKKQLEQISSRNFPANAFNEEQKRKLFFEQLFAMINGSTNPDKFDIEDDDSLKSNNSLKADIDERFSKRSPIKDKQSKSKDIDLKKNIYVPVRKSKTRRQVQNSSSFPNNLKADKKIKARHGRQLDEFINDDNADAQFYKFNKYTTRTSEDYENVETSMEQQLPYGPTDDDERSSAYDLPTTTDISITHDSVDEVDYNSNLTNFKTSTLDSQSNIPYTTPDYINVTEQDEWIPTKHTFNTIKRSRRPAKKVTFKDNVTEPSSTAKIINTPDVDKSNEGIVEEENSPIYIDSSNVSENTITNSPEKSNDENRTVKPYAKGADVKKRNDLNKTQTHNNKNVENQEVNPEKIKNVSKIVQGRAGQTQDVEVADVHSEADVRSNQSNVLRHPLSARIKLDFLIQLHALGNDEY